MGQQVVPARASAPAYQRRSNLQSLIDWLAGFGCISQALRLTPGAVEALAEPDAPKQKGCLQQ